MQNPDLFGGQDPKAIDRAQVLAGEYSSYDLQRALDIALSHIWKGNYSAFLAPLICSTPVIWATDLPSARTDGTKIEINPVWFLWLPAETRITVLLHETWHNARLHMVLFSGGKYDNKIMNYACDIRINNDLHNQGYSFKGTRPWLDLSYGDMPEEDIYDDLLSRRIMVPNQDVWGAEKFQIDPSDDLSKIIDLFPGGANESMIDPDALEGDVDLTISDEKKQAAVSNVLQARHQANISTGGRGAGMMPGDIELLINQFLKPVVPWERDLKQFMNELSNTRSSWQRPNRRYSDMYLPGRVKDREGLEHLAYFWDISGSISDADIVRFNSEVRYIKDTFLPEKLTLVQFDTQIQEVREFSKEEAFEDIKVVGRGGTDLTPVREWINEHKPTGVIIFSDLYCTPMERPVYDVPVLWVVVNNPTATAKFGKMTYIK